MDDPKYIDDLTWLDIYGNSLKRMNWKYCFAFLPKRCVKSKKTIWLKRGYRGRRWISGPGTPVLDESWLTAEEFIIFQLKNGF